MIYKIFSKDGTLKNTVKASNDFIKSFCDLNGFTFELVDDTSERTDTTNKNLHAFITQEKRIMALESAMLSMMEVTPNV